MSKIPGGTEYWGMGAAGAGDQVNSNQVLGRWLQKGELRPKQRLTVSSQRGRRDTSGGFADYGDCRGYARVFVFKSASIPCFLNYTSVPW
jgi:hypothetical protein